MARTLAESRAKHGRSRVTNGKALFLDGDVRSRASRRFRDLISDITSDLGGKDHLSTGQMQLVRRCALLSVQCEEMEAKAVAGKEFDLGVYGQLTDRLGRCLERVGLKRQAKDAMRMTVTSFVLAELPFMRLSLSGRSGGHLTFARTNLTVLSPDGPVLKLFA